MSVVEVQEIEKVFTFRGNVHTQIKQSKNAYIYSVKREDGSIDYEVFERKISNKYNFETKEVLDELVSVYPKDGAFGKTAYAINTLWRAVRKLKEIEKYILNKPE